MDRKAKWIWYDTDFEIYHHLLLACRRQEKGCDYPCMWHLSSPEKSVNFFKTFTADHDTTFRVVTHSKGMVRVEGRLEPVNRDISVKAGEHSLHVELYDIEAFPALYVDSEFLISDDSWEADAHDACRMPVGCVPEYTSPDADPRVFPFSYEDIVPIAEEEVPGGILYDYGKETFGIVSLSHVPENGVTLCYGESRKEALDPQNAIIRETLCKGDDLVRPARAFRYLFVKSEEKIDVSAQYEYLPIEDIASFRCSDPLIGRIWDLCSYTFHLNSREFYLDGIKRDRWVWSGDAYQSFMINRYLYNDPQINERTMVALFGKPPYKIHINRINDYSAYLIIAVYEHYFATGRIDFLRRIYPRVKELYEFIVSRLNADGYSVGIGDDWVFIDWGVLDKNGPHCVEQILLWKVYRTMAAFALTLGENDIYSDKADALKDRIEKDYWNAEKGAYIDSFASGRNFVSRQTNVFAVLFDFADKQHTDSIIRNVFENASLPQITTPYFKLYELMALCKCGMIEKAQNYITDYWGGMLSLGATSVWEAFDPTQNGDEHYAMYGSDYGKSLCHAWGSGPILLLMKYVVGIEPTSLGGSSFRIEPHPGIYSSFSAVCPIGDGTVNVDYENGCYTVCSGVSGGSFVLNGQETVLEAGISYRFNA